MLSVGMYNNINIGVTVKTLWCLSAPRDYTGLAINITFSPGDKDTACVNITVVEDQLLEDREIFCLLSHTDDPVFLPLNQVNITVLDTTGN